MARRGTQFCLLALSCVGVVWSCARGRAIRDAKSRAVVEICPNMNLGDAWEWADLPECPEKLTTQAFQLGINYVIYAMTH